MSEIDRLIQLLAKLPGLGSPLGPSRRALHAEAPGNGAAAAGARACRGGGGGGRRARICGNLDTRDPCAICADPRRDAAALCVVEDVADLWALERSGSFRGRYHVLGGTLSPIDGIGPEDLGIARLVARAAAPEVREVILALGFTVGGQTTAHYIVDRLRDCGVASAASPTACRSAANCTISTTRRWRRRCRPPQPRLTPRSRRSCPRHRRILQNPTPKTDREPIGAKNELIVSFDVGHIHALSSVGTKKAAPVKGRRELDREEV